MVGAVFDASPRSSCPDVPSARPRPPETASGTTATMAGTARYGGHAVAAPRPGPRTGPDAVPTGRRMPLIAGRYELAEPLGSGGMARVVAAHDRVLGRRVAVKLVHESLPVDDASAQRLLREARAAARLHHPHTVAVFDAGEDAGRPFVVMELIEGEHLGQRLGRVGRLAPAEAVPIAAAVLDALAAAHDRGLVHRDVKPSNILLPVAGGVKLADFGIAKELSALATALTATGQVLGTPRYLAPEQAAGAPAGPASDLYAVGAVLFEALAGHAPFDGPSPLAVAAAHQRDPVPSLRQAAPRVPPQLAAAVERALAKAPGDRHPDARAMREALGSALPDGDDGSVPTIDPRDAAPRPGAGPAPASETRPVSDTTPAAVDAPPDDGLDVSGGPSRRRPRRRTLLALTAALLGLGAVAAVLSGAPQPPPGADEVAGDGPPTSTAAPDDGDGADAPTADAAPEPDPVAEGSELDRVIGALATDPAGAGPRGDDLLEELLELRREEDRGDRAEDARELVRDLGTWVADGELDHEVAAATLAALRDEVRPELATLEPVAALFVDVARDPDAWGDRASKLLDELEDLLAEDDPGDAAEDARDLAEDVAGWIEDGRLDAPRAHDVLDEVGG